jgi:hypothetical protein
MLSRFTTVRTFQGELRGDQSRPFPCLDPRDKANRSSKRDGSGRQWHERNKNFESVIEDRQTFLITQEILNFDNST